RRARIRERHLPRAILEPAGLTLAVTVATLPVMLSVFQSISLISPVAHIAAVPLLAPLMVFSMLLALVSPIDALAQPVSWLVWLPATALVDITGTFGGWPNAALSTGRLPTLAALGLAAVLVAWGIAGLPEFRGLRRRWASSCPPLPMRWIAASAALAVAVVLVRPDGQLHVVALDAGQGDALFIRGPTGQTAVLARGRVDSARLASEVAQQLAVWEHKLDIALALDAAAESGMATTLGRYPADRRLTPAEDDRIDLGGGAVLDVYAVVADQAVGSPARPTPAKLILTFREHSEMLFGTSVWPYVSAVA
ncbi:MAG TPA: ComEC/Rec2 family competence protein, partial [Chloroflexota bacterium]|nr:ComEC/Rec2 family competence protein [Chloroflexota bacterium]